MWRLRVDLEGGRGRRRRSSPMLSLPEKREGPARNRRANRQRFLHGTAPAGTCLGHHLGIAPRDVRFVNGEFGKPETSPGRRGHLALQPRAFRRMAVVCAGARSRARRRRRAAPRHERRDADARRFFAPPEVEALEALDPALHRDTFFRSGRAKKPSSRPRGRGYPRASSASPFRRCADDVTLRGLDGDPAWDRWTIRGLDMPPSYAAAVAFDHREATVG